MNVEANMFNNFNVKPIMYNILNNIKQKLIRTKNVRGLEEFGIR